MSSNSSKKHARPSTDQVTHNKKAKSDEKSTDTKEKKAKKETKESTKQKKVKQAAKPVETKKDASDDNTNESISDKFEVCPYPLQVLIEANKTIKLPKARCIWCKKNTKRYVRIKDSQSIHEWSSDLAHGLIVGADIHGEDVVCRHCFPDQQSGCKSDEDFDQGDDSDIFGVTTSVCNVCSSIRPIDSLFQDIPGSRLYRCHHCIETHESFTCQVCTKKYKGPFMMGTTGGDDSLVCPVCVQKAEKMQHQSETASSQSSIVNSTTAADENNDTEE